MIVQATAAVAEFDAALLEAAITAGLAALGLVLWRRTGKPHLRDWAAVWALYAVRVLMIVTFIRTQDEAWLYWHQVLTGWCGVLVLQASLVFTRGARRRPWMLALALFPPLWSYVAIYRLEEFLLAAGPMVVFLAGATAWAAIAVLRHGAVVQSGGARLMGWALALQALHHLDYPFLRAQGAWVPWGYYLDIAVVLLLGAATLLLVNDDLRAGVDALSALSQELQRRGPGTLDAILAKPLDLPGVRGSALYLEQERRYVRAAGAVTGWTGTTPAGPAAAAVAQALADGHPVLSADWPHPERARPFPYAAVLPVFRDAAPIGALVLVGEARDPFTALDERFLVALGRQVGAALANAELLARVEARTAELERLSSRIVQLHEEERRRISRELHDETAQVFSAVKMQLGALRPALAEPQAVRLDRALALVDEGIRSIRSVTDALRPSLLDDLGLLPALRSLVHECTARTGLAVTLTAPDVLPAVSKDAELALFRALQEGLSNVLRHAAATHVAVTCEVAAGYLVLRVEDDGRGLAAPAELDRLERAGHMGLAGMRERLAVLGGSVRLEPRAAGGARLDIRLPVTPEPA